MASASRVDSERRPLQRLIALAFVLALAGAGVWRCTIYPPNIHIWGAYSTSLELLGDTCAVADGNGCFLSSDGGAYPLGLTSMTLGVYDNGSEAVLYRGQDPPLTGTQQGDRFDFVIADAGTTICGCPAFINETFWGEYFTLAAITAADGGAGDGGGGSAEALTIPVAGGCGTDPGLSDDGWLAETDAGTDLNTEYASFEGIAVDDIEPDGPASACSCQLPCTVTYLVTGHL